MVQCVLNETLV